MWAAPTAKKVGIDIDWIEAFSSCSDGPDVCFLSPPPAPGKGNASARSSAGFGRGEGFVSPRPAAEGARRKGRRGEEADGEFSARSNDNLRRDIAGMSDEELLTEIACVYSTLPAFGGLIDPEKRARRGRLLPLLEAEARRRGIDTDSAEDGGASYRGPRSDANCPFSFDIDDSGAEVARKYQRKSSPIRSTKKNYGELGVHTRRSFKQPGRLRPIPEDKMYSSKTSPTTLSGHKQRVRAVDPKEHDREKRQQIQSNFSSNHTNRRNVQLGDSSVLYSRKVNDDVVLLDDEDVQPDEPVDCGLPEEWNESKIYYPSRDDPEAVELASSDIKCLDPGVYLSSPIINYYIQYIKRDKFHREAARNNFYMFNTYFYSKLQEALSGKGEFVKLRRWWKGVNIFRRGYIVLPIHGAAHWSLVIICIPAKESNSGPVVLHLDSLGMHPTDEIYRTVRRFLEEEWKHLRKNPPSDISLSDTIWEDLPRNIHKEIVEVPGQNNAYDCGIFMLYYIQRFITEAPEIFTRDRLDMFSRSWFRSEEASKLRNEIRKLLLKEFGSARVDDVMSEAATGDGSGDDCFMKEVESEAPTADGSYEDCMMKEGESEAVSPCASSEMGVDDVKPEAATSDGSDEIVWKGKSEAVESCDRLEMVVGDGDTFEGTPWSTCKSDGRVSVCVLSEEATLSGNAAKDDGDTMESDPGSSDSEEVIEVLPSDNDSEEFIHRGTGVDLFYCDDSEVEEVTDARKRRSRFMKRPDRAGDVQITEDGKPRGRWDLCRMT
ncbi:Sentrin-specific protease 2 [Hordeum vulgare]|nr:Sentrin-specific protease 2 [Hordeum vulgare]